LGVGVGSTCQCTTKGDKNQYSAAASVKASSALPRRRG
jgi:hypothetical protein